ncbi:epsilon-sarcoglycan [Copidosoma floridanum]|uniref:epsilon-sarcoglycan n=1 Tax=Copidosoma floridanum TaxID=29053 RepID=UPI0006C94A7A|nr:epsilon-sarcoglycan [Copidosoma floridanum]
MRPIAIAGLSCALLLCLAGATEVNIYSLQVFAIPIVPQYFNWSSNVGRNEYRYEASLLGSPDLPSWIHYTYSKRTHRGYLYGVAPKDQKSFKLEIIALNKKTYETRDKILEVIVLENDSVAKYQIQLKVNNLNVEDMFDRNRTEDLFDIFRKNIWRNATDLQLTFLAPAVELGARYPLKPGEQVGTVLRLGSSTPFSPDLLKIEKEIEPSTKKFTTCDFKQVTFDRFFHQRFEFDWCYFKMIEDSQQQESARRDLSSSVIGPPSPSEWRWAQPRRADLPKRTYRREVFASVLAPALLMILLLGGLGATLCLRDEHLLISSSGKRGSRLLTDHGSTNGVQMIQYATPNSARGTLRSLSVAQPSSSPTLSDSQSINRSPRIGQDHSNLYLRPNPPPYVSLNNFGTGVRSDF